MLKLVLKIALALAAVAAAVIAVTWFRSIEGVATIVFSGREVTLDTTSLILMIGALFLALYLVLEVARRGFGALFSVRDVMRGRRRRQGVDAMSNALVALAEGDGARALRETEKAERLVSAPQITRLLSAQAARLAGDERLSERYFESMAEERRTEYLGVMGLLRQAIAEGKSERALRLAERAHALRPQKAEVIDLLFDLQRKKGDWDGARRTTLAAIRVGRFTRDVGERRRAVLYLAEAQERDAKGDAAAALEQATAAIRLAPGLTPAATLAARLMAAKGDARGATRALVAAWRQLPHPDVAEAFAALEPTETADARFFRCDKLVSAAPTAPESKLLRAELALAAGRVQSARNALVEVLEAHPTARGFALMAAVAQAEGADEAVLRAWLSRAASAPRSPQWVCANCGAPSASWGHSCPSCGAFDQLVWKRIDGADTALDAAIAGLLVRSRAENGLPSTSHSGASLAVPNGGHAPMASGRALATRPETQPLAPRRGEVIAPDGAGPR